MKHVLLATTALVAFAGAAAAEITVTGESRIGLRYDSDQPYTCAIDADDDPTTPDVIVADGCERDTWNVVNRIRAWINMAGETDSGLSFGAELQVDTADSAGDGFGSFGDDNSVWISGAYGRLEAGDVNAAIESAVGDLPEIGLTELENWNEMSYSTTDATNVGIDVDGDGDDDIFEDYSSDATLLYSYQFGDASLYASFTDSFFDNSAVRKGDAWSLGAGYTLGNYTFGIGYEDAEYFVLPFDADEVIRDVDAKTWGISGGTSWQGITFKAIYLSSDIEDDLSDDQLDVKQYGIGAEYAMANGIGLAGYYRKVEFNPDGPDNDTDVAAYGIGASYDLGGGATLLGGIAKLDSDDGDFIEDRTIADFGLEVKF